MNKPIDDMTPDELRDALAASDGWENHSTSPIDQRWYRPPQYAEDSMGSTGEAWCDHNPIPFLNTPEALGAIARMMPASWWFNTANHPDISGGPDSWQASASESTAHMCIPRPPIQQWATGPTETIARARLVLKVLAATGAKA